MTWRPWDGPGQEPLEHFRRDVAAEDEARMLIGFALAAVLRGVRIRIAWIVRSLQR